MTLLVFRNVIQIHQSDTVQIFHSKSQNREKLDALQGCSDLFTWTVNISMLRFNSKKKVYIKNYIIKHLHVMIKMGRLTSL